MIFCQCNLEWTYIPLSDGRVALLVKRIGEEVFQIYVLISTLFENARRCARQELHLNASKQKLKQRKLLFSFPEQENEY